MLTTFKNLYKGKEITTRMLLDFIQLKKMNLTEAKEFLSEIEFNEDLKNKIIENYRELLVYKTSNQGDKEINPAMILI